MDTVEDLVTRIVSQTDANLRYPCFVIGQHVIERIQISKVPMYPLDSDMGQVGGEQKWAYVVSKTIRVLNYENNN